MNWLKRSISDDNNAGVFLSRLIAISIPMLILIILQSGNALGIAIWPPLLSVSFAFALLVTGVIIMVLGLEAGFIYPTLIIFFTWVISAYTYIQFEANMI